MIHNFAKETLDGLDMESLRIIDGVDPVNKMYLPVDPNFMLAMVKAIRHYQEYSLANVIAEKLTELSEADPEAMKYFMLETPKFNCNETLAEHPNAQVEHTPGGYYISLLGLLQGLIDTSKELIVMVKTEGEPLKFISMDRTTYDVISKAGTIIKSVTE